MHERNDWPRPRSFSPFHTPNMGNVSRHFGSPKEARKTQIRTMVQGETGGLGSLIAHPMPIPILFLKPNFACFCTQYLSVRYTIRNSEGSMLRDNMHIHSLIMPHPFPSCWQPDSAFEFGVTVSHYVGLVLEIPIGSN